MPAHAQPPAAYVVVVEYEDGTVGTSLVLEGDESIALTPSREQLRFAAWSVAYSLADEDKERIHDMSGGGFAPQPGDPTDGVYYRVADEPEDDGIDVYVQPMGRVHVSAKA